MMNNKFTERLEEFLNTECSDFGLDYNWEWIEDCNWCEVTITSENTEYLKILNFRYIESVDDLQIELSEGSFYTTREFDSSVKYFWILVSPSLFPDA